MVRLASNHLLPSHRKSGIGLLAVVQAMMTDGIKTCLTREVVEAEDDKPTVNGASCIESSPSLPTSIRRHSTGGSGDEDRWHHDLFDQIGDNDDGPTGDGVPPANDLRALLRAKGGNLQGAGGKLGGRLGGKVQVGDLRHKLSGGSGGKGGNGGRGGKVTRGRLDAGGGGSAGIFAAEGERGGNGEAVARGRGGEGMVVRGRGAVTNLSSLSSVSFRSDERMVVGGDVGGVVRVAAAAAAAASTAAGGRGGGERLVKQQQPRQQHQQQQQEQQQRRLTVVVANDGVGGAGSVRRRSTVVGAVGVGKERGLAAMDADVAMEGGDEQQVRKRLERRLCVDADVAMEGGDEQQVRKREKGVAAMFADVAMGGADEQQVRGSWGEENPCASCGSCL
ncbi:unnamed protein product [Closterium sp. Naga37s-1]|nr:unnamed protein product [Closterium sp. Naga37s-1]